MKRSLWSFPIVFSTLAVTGFEIAGDIFKAGVWVGALLVIGVIGLIIWMIAKA